MSTIDQFLKDLLASQELNAEQEKTLQEHKKEVTDYIRTKFGNDPVIKYAGSREKGTMNSDNYDLDIVCYFPSDDTRTLKAIRDDVATHLREKYTIHSKNSAERITNLRGKASPGDYHIDVVPGRFIQNTKDVFLHVASGEKERLQTNLKTHIDHIVNSNCVPVIRLVKLWSNRNGLAVKTFVLELFVVEILSGSHTKDDLKKSFRTVMAELADRFETIQLIDPANTNNVVSRLIDDSDKTTAAQKAKDTLSKIGTSDDLAKWKEVFCEKDENSSSGPSIVVPKPASGGFTPHSPWCNI